MLDIMEILQLLADGKDLPQQEFQEIPLDTISKLQDAEAKIIAAMFEELDSDDGNPDQAISVEIDRLISEYGWWNACSVLGMHFGIRYTMEQIPPIDVSEETSTLLKGFAIAGQNPEEEGIWTIPLAMLASAGESKATEFTKCAALCAGIGALHGLTN